MIKCLKNQHYSAYRDTTTPDFTASMLTCNHFCKFNQNVFFLNILTSPDSALSKRTSPSTVIGKNKDYSEQINNVIFLIVTLCI
ncbi:hypothetical protein XBJ1_3801 [Xenorhabdus bovienii SS-2004]|uniref:Uncharacterized protein n=1 Tax=Xenorhabdus bovienii (strain SS-2004) TaxID=406818 RepID=D3V5J0_XENBS|nr:hypothetical protein XBJ1_3801 [Xenorhabdus bovienii SS-2004]